MSAAFSGTRIERNTSTSRMKAPSTTAPITIGQVLLHQVGEVDQGGGLAADVGLEAGAGDGLVDARPEVARPAAWWPGRRVRSCGVIS